VDAMNDLGAVLRNERRWAVACGDAESRLRTLPDGCVHTSVSSPPYYALRDYGVDGQIGLESSPEAFIERLVSVYREVRRVLRDDGTAWVNMGDSYNADGRKGRDHMGEGKNNSYSAWQNKTMSGTKPKDMMGIPWMLAFALRADGWYLRQDIIWHKPNPMPESVKDRCTKSHEYLFLLSKTPRYYFDAEAICEPCSPNTNARISQNLMDQIGSHRANGGSKTNGPMRAVIKGSTRKLAEVGLGIKTNASFEEACSMPVDSRNKRSVWTISTKSYKGAHFATFPPDLVEPCIRAGTSEHGVCDQCGSPFVRTMERERVATRPGTASKVLRSGQALDRQSGELVECGNKPWSSAEVGNRDPQRHVTRVTTTGWESSCECIAPNAIGGVVLDPFAGSGTTIEVAVDLGRRGIGTELNPAYVKLVRKRMRGVTAPLAVA
jgi:DNA modification methylase